LAPQKVVPDKPTQITFFHEVARIEMIKKSASALYRGQMRLHSGAQAHR
jgi:hypothetical protein